MEVEKEKGIFLGEGKILEFRGDVLKNGRLQRMRA